MREVQKKKKKKKKEKENGNNQFLRREDPLGSVSRGMEIGHERATRKVRVGKIGDSCVSFNSNLQRFF